MIRYEYIQGVPSALGRQLSFADFPEIYPQLLEGPVSLKPTIFDLRELLSSLEAMLQLKARSKGLLFRLELLSELPDRIQADEAKIRQVLTNLLSNAIKFWWLRINQRAVICWSVGCAL